MLAEGYALPARRAGAIGADRVRYLLTHVFGITLVLAALAWAANRSGLDLQLASWLYDPVARAFPLRDSRWLDLLGHRIILVVPVGLGVLAFAAALASYRLPVLRPWRPVLWALVATLCLIPLAIGQLKHHTALPRPYNLSLFGGYAAYPLHWWAASRAEAGGALPSSHAGAGYALLVLYFCGWALDRPRLRWGGLALGIGAGLLFSTVRILQGAHFLSQTLWSAALVWLLASVLFLPLVANRRRAAPARPRSLDAAWTRLTGVQVRRRHTLWGLGLLVGATLPVLHSAWMPGQGLHEAAEQAGLVLIFLSILGRAWCSLYLGGRKGRELMTQGPYSVSRNPLYVFSLMGVVGMGAQSGSLLLGPLLAVLVYVVFSRVIGEEESLLRQAFGGEFDDYCRRVPRFGPRLSAWRSAERIEISLPALWRTVRDALPFLLALPIFEIIETLQHSGWLPVLVHLP